jgi:hypothetical protein
MKERAFITLTLAVDLDMVPGVCHQPEDFVTFIENALKGAAHYQPMVTVHLTEVIPYEWDDEKGYVAPKGESSLTIFCVGCGVKTARVRSHRTRDGLACTECFAPQGSVDLCACGGGDVSGHDSLCPENEHA